jgi:hypothetical protein
MDAGGVTRNVALANMLPYRGVTVDDIPNRVWDLPPELRSDLEEASTEPGRGTVEANETSATSAGISQGWTTQLGSDV